uniref:FACT complex subunit SSRP1 n=1 Tax=Strigamia maritima TaxID=126957 RepID=T1JNC3_STRMM
MDFLEFADASQEVRGSMNHGRLKLTNQAIIFKNSKTGKVDQIQASDIEAVSWQRLAKGHGLRVITKNELLYRFGGLKETELEKLSKFFEHNYELQLREKDFSVRGWNWGTAKFHGSVLSFDVGRETAFEIPLMNVSHCTTAKNEVTLEFHQNDDAAVQLMELRFHIPTDAAETDAIQTFHDNVMSKASIIQATGDAISTFKEVQCLTPRGRYDIKIFPSFIQLHGKTFDYKIPLTTVLRLFLLPHKDQRQMFFVVSLDPPIKQGQTRYHFLIFLFSNEEETTLTLGLSEKDLRNKFEGKLKKEMSGPTYEVVSRIMKALVQRKITVPGGFIGNSHTPAVSCSYKAAAGLLYPLERGFIYVHKPPIHIRFEEVASVNFARSGGSTRSFDFEVEIKSGVVHTFSSIEKEEYGKLFDFITGKKLRVKNRGQLDQPNYNEEDLVDSDMENEPDLYLARVKAEAQERHIGGDDSDDESDVSFNPGDGSGSEVAEEYDSNHSSSSEEGSDENGKPPEKKKPKKKAKERKPREPGTRKPRKKKEKDSNKPKRPQTAFFLWLNENRERIKKETPGIAVTEITKKAGEEWKEVKDKTKWEKLSEEGKKKYEVAMAEYKESLKNAEDADDKTPPKKSEKSSKPSKAKGKKAAPQKSPTKSPKSKEYISSSDGSSSEKEEKSNSPKKEEEEEDEPMEASSNADSDSE